MNRIFKKYTGKTIKNFVNELKIADVAVTLGDETRTRSAHQPLFGINHFCYSIHGFDTNCFFNLHLT